MERDQREKTTPAASSSSTFGNPTHTPSSGRQLPGYGTPVPGLFQLQQPGTAVSNRDNTGSSQSDQLGAPVATGSFLSQPYRTREYLYYEGETKAQETAASSQLNANRVFSSFGDVDVSHRPVSSITGSSDGKSQTTNLAARLVEDMPPTVSMHQLGLTPDRRQTRSSSEGMSPTTTTNTAAIPEALMLSPMVAAASNGAGLQSLAVEEERVGENAFEMLEDNWVTVYGYAPGQAHVLLSYFTRLAGGSLTAVRQGQGNWMHLCFPTKWSAQKALAKNASILPCAPCTMVGVLPMRSAISAINAASESLTSSLRPENPSLDGASASISVDQSTGIFASQVALNATATDGANNRNLQVENEPSIFAKVLGAVFGW